MLKLAGLGLSEGIWLRADQQIAGRGRQGREWVSPAGNLHASTLVRLRADDPAAPGLALVAGVALAETIALLAPIKPGGWGYLDGLPDDDRPATRHGTGVGLQLKWPNDLLLGRAKLAGILLERAGDAVVVGVGVNVAHQPDNMPRPVTSLAAHGVMIAPSALLTSLAAAFSGLLATWRTDGLTPIRAIWLAVAHPIGTPLTVHAPDGSTLSGSFDGLDADGALLLRLASGERRVIHAGDVFLI